MSTKDWAERECQIACKRENPDWDGKSFDYGCSCYQSALKAYKSLCEDGHSGFSFSVTKTILIRLMNGLPLTSLEDKEGEWDETVLFDSDNGIKSYQHKRMSRLFKHIDKDGNVSYSDCGRDYCQEITDPKDTYSGGCVGNILDELFPISMPYYPTVEKYKFVVDTFSAEGFEGDKSDWNTRAVLYVITPKKDKVEINRYFGEKDGKLVEITKGEFNKRVKARKEERKVENI